MFSPRYFLEPLNDHRYVRTQTANHVDLLAMRDLRSTPFASMELSTEEGKHLKRSLNSALDHSSSRHGSRNVWHVKAKAKRSGSHCVSHDTIIAMISGI